MPKPHKVSSLRGCLCSAAQGPALPATLPGTAREMRAERSVDGEERTSMCKDVLLVAEENYRSLDFHLPTSAEYLVTLSHKDIKDGFNSWNFLHLQRTTRLRDRYVGIHLAEYCNFSSSAVICKPQTLKWARGYVNVPYLFLFSLAEAVK